MLGSLRAVARQWHVVRRENPPICSTRESEHWWEALRAVYHDIFF
jgi:hypothetical protein